MEALDKWHKTRQGYLVFGLIELAIAYGFASWAIDTAHLWAYALGIIFFFGGVRNLIRIFRTPKNEHQRH